MLSNFHDKFVALKTRKERFKFEGNVIEKQQKGETGNGSNFTLVVVNDVLANTLRETNKNDYHRSVFRRNPKVFRDFIAQTEYRHVHKTVLNTM